MLGKSNVKDLNLDEILELWKLDSGTLDHIRSNYYPGDIVARVFEKILLQIYPIQKWWLDNKPTSIPHHQHDYSTTDGNSNSKIHPSFSNDTLFDNTNRNHFDSQGSLNLNNVSNQKMQKVVYEVPKETLERIKSELRAEVYKDLVHQVNKEVMEHPSSLSISQVQRFPDSGSDNITDEINDMKLMIGKVSTKIDGIEKHYNEFSKRIPVAETQISTMKGEIINKVSKDDFQSIQLMMPNLLTKQDNELIEELIRAKPGKDELNKITISIESVKESTKNFCPNSIFNSKIFEIEERIKKLFEIKTDKSQVMEKFTDITDTFKLKDDILENYKLEVKELFSMKQKQITKVEKSIESKADREIIFEIKEHIRELAHKDMVKDMEDKVFPIMKSIMEKVESFDDSIKDSRDAVLRVDELILDKANKYDLQNITKRVKNCVGMDEWNVFVEKQDQINVVLNDRTKVLINETEKNKTLAEFANENVEKINKDIMQISDKQSAIVTQNDINELKEMIKIKADHTDLSNLYEIKANKVDFKTMIESVNFIHHQLQYASKVTFSAIYMMNKIMESENDNENLTKANLLKNSIEVINWIKDSKIGDIYLPDDHKMAKNLKSFDRVSNELINEVSNKSSLLKNKSLLGLKIKKSSKNLSEFDIKSPRLKNKVNSSFNNGSNIKSSTKFERDMSLDGEPLSPRANLSSGLLPYLK